MRNSKLKAAAALSLILTFMIGPAFTQRKQQEFELTGLRKVPRGLTVQKLKTHVLVPAHTKNVEMEVVDEAREVAFKRARPKVTIKSGPRLDVVAFAAAVHEVMKGRTAGYIMHVRQNGNLIYNSVWEWAQTPSDQSKAWTPNTRMHVASVSKFLTAVGLVKLLDSKGISYDAKIVDYLPSYWVKGPNVDKITFRHLLNHKSGFGGESSASDYAFMKLKVMVGVASPGSNYDYENMNFGLMRILIPVINGDITKDYPWPAPIPKDQAWDAFTISAYRDYMQDNVFGPAGVANADFAPPPLAIGSALAYAFPAGNGWNSGDLQTMAGGAAWRLSIKELLDVMNHFRRKNTIVSSGKAQDILQNNFGIDRISETAAGNIYDKNGRWRTNGRTEQSVIYFLPNGMEVAVFVNSPIGFEDYSLRNVVRDAFKDSLSE
jgi:CubicO group peptidase (beta-lactamase class C family)